MKWQHMGFFCGKKSVLDQNQKNPDKKFQSWNSKPFKVHELSNLDPRTTPHMQGQSNRAMIPSPEACCMIEGWGPKHLWKRACIQAASEAHFAVSLTTDTSSTCGLI